MTDKRRPLPDLQEVMARARAMNADAVDELFDGQEAASADVEARSVVAFVPREEPIEPGLDQFLGGVRRSLDARAQQRALRPIPQAPIAASPKRGWWLGAAAAACLMAGGAAWSFVGAQGQSDARAQHLASASANDSQIHGDAETRTQRASTDRSFSTSLPVTAEGVTTESVAVEPPAPEPVESPAQALERADASANEPLAARDDKRSALSRSRSMSTTQLESLEQQAQAAWAAGELAKAEALLHKLIASTRSRARKEQAYGDLLSLAELRSDARRSTKLWKTYLRQFPSGRYADDLRARLCRQSGDSACWSDYLKKAPKGAHRHEAQTAVRD